MWQNSKVAEIPPSLAGSSVVDLNFPAISNASAGPSSLGLQVTYDGIYVRVVAPTDVNMGTWVTGSVAWRIGRDARLGRPAARSGGSGRWIY